MPDTWKQHISEMVDKRAAELVELRRHLHRYPEPSGEEVATSRHLQRLLNDHGIRAHVPLGGRGVIADSEHQSAPRRIAVRGDIDGLLLSDAKQVDYRSTVEGVMHACGHDAHATIAFGAVLALHELAQRGELPCPVTWRGIFQPAEETATGASEMIAAGALADVDAIFSTHVDPTRRTGVVGVRKGAFTAHCDDMNIEVEGVASHAARPHESKDTIAASAKFISSLYQQIPRTFNSQDAVVVAITQIHGGTNANVIPDRVVMTGMIRTLDRDVRTQAVAHVTHVAEAVGNLTGTRIHLQFGVRLPGVVNDGRLTQLFADVAGNLLGADRVQWINRPSMGGEDFAVYLEHVPGMMFRLGCSPDTAPAAGLHTPLFDIDERCLAVGAKLLATAVVEASINK